MVLALPVTPPHVHGGGVLCGQTMMAAADTAMVLAVMQRARRLQADDDGAAADQLPAPDRRRRRQARITARVLRMGKNLVFGEIEVADPRGELAAHATTTYALCCMSRDAEASLAAGDLTASRLDYRTAFELAPIGLVLSRQR